MFEGTYISLMVLAFVFAAFAYVISKSGSRLAVQIISVILFASLAAAAQNIETKECDSVTTLSNSTLINYTNQQGTEVNNTLIRYNNDIICETDITNDSALVWINLGFAIAIGALAFITALNMTSGKEE